MCTIALGLMFADYNYEVMSSMRSKLSIITSPIYWVANFPSELGEWASTHLATRSSLQAENQRLQAESLILQSKVQKLAAMTAEVNRLRQLLNTADKNLNESVLVADLVSASPDPARHEVVINKGLADNVYVGQPVLDSEGLMGQVTEVSQFHSRVLLITDVRHSVPIQVVSNGVRGIADGSGSMDSLQLRHVPATMEIKVGDKLVSSGLGQRFPIGYPVGEVTEIKRDPGQPFIDVIVRPFAKLNQARHLLLVFTEKGLSKEETALLP